MSSDAFSVRVAELEQLAERTGALSASVREVGAVGAASVCVVSGAAELDGQLSRFQTGWLQHVQALASAEEAFGRAVLAAAASYVLTDESVMPSAAGGSADASAAGAR